MWAESLSSQAVVSHPLRTDRGVGRFTTTSAARGRGFVSGTPDRDGWAPCQQFRAAWEAFSRLFICGQGPGVRKSRDAVKEMKLKLQEQGGTTTVGGTAR